MRSNAEWEPDGTGPATAAGLASFRRRTDDVRVIHANTLPPGEAGVAMLLRAVAEAAPTHAVLLRRAFKPPPVDASVASLAERAGEREYAASNAFDVSGQQACAARGSWRRRSGALSLAEALGPRPTDFHIFHASPLRDGEGFLSMCRGAFAAGSAERLLLDHSMAGIHPAVARVLRRGHRHIFTAMRRGASVQFHQHGATWFALTHGLKQWWLAPPVLGEQLSSLGSSYPFPAACGYLAQPGGRPDPRIQRALQVRMPRPAFHSPYSGGPYYY